MSASADREGGPDENRCVDDTSDDAGPGLLVFAERSAEEQVDGPLEALLQDPTGRAGGLEPLPGEQIEVVGGPIGEEVGSAPDVTVPLGDNPLRTLGPIRNRIHANSHVTRLCRTWRVR
jgi:hypothetical protein